MLVSQISKDFADGVLNFTCPKMELRQEGSDSPIVYKGSGIITCCSKRKLGFRLICSEATSPELEAKRFLRDNQHKAGEILGASSYYSLRATDLYGHTWESSRLHIESDSGPGGVCMSGELHTLTQSEPFEINMDTVMVDMQFLEDVDLPFNKSTRKYTEVAGEQVASSCGLDRAEIEAGSWRVVLRKENSELMVEARSDGGMIPPHFETRIVETLQFITGRSLSWAILRKLCDGVETTTLRSSASIENGGKLQTPCNLYIWGSTAEAVWHMFAQYLQHILTFETDPFKVHPLSAWLNFARGSCKASILNGGLALGVAIEGILNAEFSNVANATNAFKEKLDEVKQYMNDWTGDLKIKDRIRGAIGAMSTARAEDRLRELVANGTISKDGLHAWKAIRNAGAHARPPEDDDVQKWLDNCDKIQVLLYHLIFSIIGYKGQYTDYGTRGWPQNIYPLNATED